MEGNLGTFTQWVQFVILVVGLISVLIRIGSTQGKQEEKNKNFEETQKIQREEIDVIKSDISIIKTDIAYIKGKLL